MYAGEAPCIVHLLNVIGGRQQSGWEHPVNLSHLLKNKRSSQGHRRLVRSRVSQAKGVNQLSCQSRERKGIWSWKGDKEKTSTWTAQHESSRHSSINIVARHTLSFSLRTLQDHTTEEWSDRSGNKPHTEKKLPWWLRSLVHTSWPVGWNSDRDQFSWVALLIY